MLTKQDYEELGWKHNNRQFPTFSFEDYTLDEYILLPFEKCLYPDDDTIIDDIVHGVNIRTAGSRLFEGLCETKEELLKIMDSLNIKKI